MVGGIAARINSEHTIGSERTVKGKIFVVGI